MLPPGNELPKEFNGIVEILYGSSVKYEDEFMHAESAYPVIGYAMERCSLQRRAGFRV